MPDIDDIKGVKVQLDNGEVWNAHIDDGQLYFDNLISQPPQQGQPQGGGQTPPPPSPMQEMISKMPDKGTGGEGQKQQQSNSTPPPISDNVFKARLSSIMLDNKYDRRIRGRTRGKLDMKALYKVPTLARSIFTQKTARKNKEYNIVLLVDRSGSMDDMDSNNKRKYQYATEICNFLVKSFEGLNINTSVISFDNETYILKNFNSKPDYSKIANGLLPFGVTVTYGAMNRAYQMFNNRKGKNIMLVLTDGDSGIGLSRNYYDIKDNLEDKIKIEKNIKDKGVSNPGDKSSLHALVNSHKDVTTIGVGIQSDCSNIVPTNFEVDNLQDLKPKIIEILKKEIKRG